MKQEIEFIKFNPTQNMTILVKTNHPTEDYKQIATKMMSYDSVNAEQVGFIGKSLNNAADAYLKMAGGEFCGNACMSLATLIASEKGLHHDEHTEILLEVSGSDTLIMCQVRRNVNEHICQLTMPIPKTIEKRTIKYGREEIDVVIVSFHEFVHIVIEVKRFSDKVREEAQRLAKSFAAKLEANLIGILLYKSKSGELAPLIYVHI